MPPPESPDPVTIASAEGLVAEISPLGAELRRLRAPDGVELLWDGDPAFWTGHAPVLFPIVGALAGDRFRHQSQSYTLPRHGFARRRPFTLIDHEGSRVTYRLSADAETRAVYPFDFQLDLTYAAIGSAIAIAATVTNAGDAEMPFSLGFHPALRWPFEPGTARADYRLNFEADEPGHVSRLNAAGLVARTEPSPIADRTLPLDDHLFVDDAMVLAGLASRSVSFGVPGRRQLSVSFPDFPDLGIWSKPGAGFLCIEPWQGYADPAGFDGDLDEKPGVIRLPAGSSWHGRMTIELSE